MLIIHCIAILVSMLLCLLVTERYEFVNVRGESMLPTLQNGSIGAVANSRHLVRGDIVVVQPFSTGDQLVKRIVGMPGELVVVQNGEVYCDGKKIEEDYVKFNSIVEYWEVLLEPDEYFILGDNREDSLDSRYFGPVKCECIVGKFYALF